MKRLLLAVTLLTSLLSPARALGGSFDGNHLLKGCLLVVHFMDNNNLQFSSDDELQMGACMGSIKTITETNIIYKKTTNHPMFCPPKPGVPNGQATRIVVKYLKNNPEKLELDGVMLAISALMEAYPCH